MIDFHTLEQVAVQAAETSFFSKDQPRTELKENGLLFELLCDSEAFQTVLTETIVRVAHGELDIDHLTEPVVVL